MYCVHCGIQVGARDRFCGKCGAPQPVSATTAAQSSGLPGGVSAQNWALLCYIPLLGWIACVIVLASNSFRRDARVRFHAFQGLYLFAAWLLVDWVVAPLFFAPGFGFPFYRLFAALLKLCVIGAGIFMMIRVVNGDDYRLPILGELADRSVAEQRL
jgi:uncharacterized membrane protein